MAKVGLFLLLPETSPTNRWMVSTEEKYSDEDAYEKLIDEIKCTYESIEIEKYEGFYDALNVKNFFELYDTLDDCYPYAPKKIFRSIISKNAFIDWRQDIIQKRDNEYQIFRERLNDNTFCEIAERKNLIPDDYYVLMNHHAFAIQNNIAIKINGQFDIDIDTLQSKEEIVLWFVKNRQPSRKFNINPKHGENRQEIKQIGGETISPLRCSREKAQTLLNSAIGDPEKELYNLDTDFNEIIVFKYEGPTPQNMYHGYHVPNDSNEIPNNIRKKFRL